MLINNDFPEVFAVDSKNSTDLQNWWDTLGDSWVRVNLVTDTLGNTVGASGSSKDLTGGADRDVLAALRAEADVIVLGGATVRAEPESVPKRKDVIIVTKSGNIPIDAIKRARGRLTVLHGRSANLPPVASGVPLGRFTGAAIVKAVRALGYSKILCEGGITLASALADSGVVDEWCQTVSPTLGARSSGLVVPTLGGSLSNVAHDVEGYRYTRRSLSGAPEKR